MKFKLYIMKIDEAVLFVKDGEFINQSTSKTKPKIPLRNMTQRYQSNNYIYNYNSFD